MKPVSYTHLIEQAEAIREENQVYADALEEAKGGEIPRKRGRLQEQVVALTAENKDLTARLLLDVYKRQPTRQFISKNL